MLEITRYKPLDKAPLVASASIKFDSSYGPVIIHDVCLFQQGQKKWLGMPGKKSAQGKFFSNVFFEDRDNAEKLAKEVFDLSTKNLNVMPKDDNLPF